MNEELISIIVPVYNVEAYIHQCIKSIIEQSYKNLEIILVDDGSKDKSGKICDDYARKDKRIKVIHKKNGGLSDSRNAGITVATGKYIAFVDSDDWIEKNMYEKMYNECEKFGADICICGFFREYKDKTISECNFGERVYDTESALEELIKGRVIKDHAGTKLYKRFLWDNVEYPVGKVYEDIRTTYKIIQKSKMVCLLPDSMYHYRQRKGSIARSGFSEQKIEWLEAVKEMEANIKKNTSEYDEVLYKRIMEVECSLLREYFLYSTEERLKKNYLLGKKIYLDIRKNRRIFWNRNTTKVFKLISLMSYFPMGVTAKIFKSNAMKQYIEKKYVYYV